VKFKEGKVFKGKNKRISLFPNEDGSGYLLRMKTFYKEDKNSTHERTLFPTGSHSLKNGIHITEIAVTKEAVESIIRLYLALEAKS
jgi:hypothetical protein